MSVRNLKISVRAVLFFSLILVIILSLGAVSIVQMSKLRDAEQEVESNWMASLLMADRMDSSLLRLRLEIFRSFIVANGGSRDDFSAGLRSYHDDLWKVVDDYKRAGVEKGEEAEIYDSVLLGVNEYSDCYEKFLGMLQRHELDAAVSLLNNKMKVSSDRLQENIVGLRKYNVKQAHQAGVRASDAFVSGYVVVGALLLVAVVATILVALVLVRSIVLPITEAVKVAQRIAKKNLSENIRVEGKDEAAQMLSALAQMQSNLRETISGLANSSNQLASASEEMSAVTDEANRDLLRQNDEVNQAATAITEMSTAVVEVSRNAAEAAQASHNTQKLTNTGLDNVSHTVSVIKNLAENFNQTSEHVQHLSDRAQEIGNVVGVIRSIAEKTNLLALNAAIEAARAGEQGRGFAVVADEVRALAHQTQVSTGEIEKMITLIQNDSVMTVSAMEQSLKMANDSTTVAQHANLSLQQIAEAMVMINERNAQIAAAAEEQAKVARELDKNLTTIRDLSTKSAVGSSQTASASSEVAKLAVGLSHTAAEFVF